MKKARTDKSKRSAQTEPIEQRVAAVLASLKRAASKQTRNGMGDTRSDFSEFDRIADEVLAGTRAFAFWPGTGAMVTIVMLHVLALGIWLGPTFFASIPWLK